MVIRAAGQQRRFAELNEEAVAVMQQTAIAGAEQQIFSILEAFTNCLKCRECCVI